MVNLRFFNVDGEGWGFIGFINYCMSFLGSMICFMLGWFVWSRNKWVIIYLFNRCLLRAFFVIGIILDVGGRIVIE